jgi:hypothetical protein
MSAGRHPLAWAPPFLVGAAAAMAAETAVSILLYAGVGFLRSLTVILAIEGAALAAGLWSAPAPGPGVIERLRMRWLVCLGAYLTATLYGGLWSLEAIAPSLAALTDGRVGQALGLTILAALPLYAAGGVLGGLQASVSVGGGAGSLAAGRPSASAALGAAVGFVLTGMLLPRTVLPASLLVACIVMLSLGGMLFGVMLGSVLDVRVLADRSSTGVGVRVEDRSLGGDAVSDRVLLEGGHERRRLALARAAGAAGPAPWDVAVARLLMPAPEQPWSVLVVGGGATSLARAVLREHPTGTLDVLERTAVVVELAREHFGTDLHVGSSERVRVTVGNLEDLLQGVVGPYDLVLVDASSLAPLGGARALSRAARTRLVEAVAADGSLVWGPTRPDRGVDELVAGWPHAVFERSTERVDAKRDTAAPAEVVIVTRRERLDVPLDFDGFASTNGRPA